MKKSLYTLLALGFFGITNAQQLPLFSQYYYNKFLYNPAFTGSDGATNAYLVHRSQWKDIPGAPTTYALTLDGSVKQDVIGLGMSVFNDQTDIINRTGIYSSYSYKVTLSGDHQLAIGLSAGVLDYKVDFSRVSVQDVNDPLLYADNRRKISMDANFGVAYLWNDLQVGISVPQIIGNKIKLLEQETNVYTTLKRHFLGSVLYRYKINDDFTLLPNAMVRYTKGTPFQFDINAAAEWRDLIRAGVSYRFGYALGMNVGAVYNNLTAGYTYEYVLSSIGAVSGGGHEIMLGYRFGGSKKDDDRVKKLEEQMYQSQMQNDSTINALKKQDAEHTEEINKLKEELEKVKNQQPAEVNKDTSSTGNNNSRPVNEEDKKNIRAENAVDYADENGAPIQPGYYVIMGAFKSKENAQRSKASFEKKGPYQPTVIFNKVRGFHYVNVFYTTDEETALDIMDILRAEQPDAWVFKMM